MTWLKKFVTHYVLYIVLLLVLCLGIFPVVILYRSSTSIAELLDRVVAGKKFAQRLDGVWDTIGIPYDYLVKAVG